MATRDPSPNRASRIGRGKRAGPRPGARDTDAADDQERADESVKHRAARRCPSLPSRLEPQPRGAVTRRAVAQRRSRAGGLTRRWAEAIRGFGLGFVVGPLARSAAVWRKMFVFSSLPIRKVLVLPFAGGVSPPLSLVSLLFLVSYPQDRCSYYLFFTTCSLTICECYPFDRIHGRWCYPFDRISWEVVLPV